KKCAAAEFLQNAGALVFLLEPAERPVDRLMLLYNNSYQNFSFKLGRPKRRYSPLSSGFSLNYQLHRAMVAAHHQREDSGLLYTRHQPFGHEEIVDAPADIALAGLAEVVPVGVLLRLVIEAAKNIHVAHIGDL